MNFQEIAKELLEKAKGYKKSQYMYEQDWGHGIELAVLKLTQAKIDQQHNRGEHIMKWNDYKKVKPPKRQKMYLVTARTNSRHLIVVSSCYYKSEEIRDNEGYIVRDHGWTFDDDVVAWAELPAPFHKKK